MSAHSGESMIAATVDRLRAAPGPVVVGPWMEEVGFEVLYWIPFLTWLSENHELDTRNWIVVSRGGTRSWYGEIAAGGYADLFDVLSPAAFKAANEERWREVGSQKQRFDSDVEATLLEELERSGALPGDYDVLHPSAMYRPFWQPWKESAPGGLVERSTLHTRLPVPPLPEGIVLPESFVAMKWYFRPSLPDEPAARRRIREITEAVASEMPVVLLHGHAQLDDHDEVDLSGVAGAQAALSCVPATQNLEVQSAIIARASRFVGTYGGLGYLPMRYGVPSLLYASHPRHLSGVHVRTGMAVAAQLGVEHELVDLISGERVDSPDAILRRCG